MNKTIKIPGKDVNPSMLDEHFQKSLEQLSNTNVADVQKIVASQLDIMRAYHSIVQSQAQKSFTWASIFYCSGDQYCIYSNGKYSYC